MNSVTFTLNLQKGGSVEKKVLTFHKSKDINVENLRRMLVIEDEEIISVIEGDDDTPDSNWRKIEKEEDLGKDERFFFVFFF